MRALIVGSSSVDRELLLHEIEKANLVVCCDGGLHHFLGIDIFPDIVLGDFDSYDGEVPEGAIIYEKEKDFSDLEAALLLCEKKGIKNITILGATGKRLDHFLVALFGLFNRAANVVLKDSRNKIFIKTEDFRLVDEGYPYFSLIPLDETILSIKGAKYDLEQKKVSPGSSITLSNEFKEREVAISFSPCRMIVVLSDDNKKTL